MKKRIVNKALLTTLVVLFLFCLSHVHTYANESDAISTESGTLGDNITWTLNEGVLTLSGKGRMADFTSSDHLRQWVKNSSHDSFVYPNGITSIIIEDGITSIGDYAFEHCFDLTNVSIPDSVKSIGAGAFDTCGIEIIQLPGNLESIGENAFRNCNLLSAIEIPVKISVIENNTFQGCHNLRSVDLPNCIIRIGKNAFYDCDNLQEIVIPDAVTTIEDGAFGNCKSLSKLDIPASVTDISSSAFVFCSNIGEITVSRNNNIYDSRNDCNAILKTADNELVLGCKNTIIPSEVTAIGDNAFFEMHNLTSVKIPNGVTKIGAFAFSGCSELTSIDIPDSVITIGNGAFGLCYKLEYVKLSNSIHQIPSSVFATCNNLKSINVPDGVKVIGSYAFSSCENLNTVHLPDSIVSIGEFAFGNCNNIQDIYYRGYEDEWNEIYLDNGNKDLSDAELHFYTIVPVTGVTVKCGGNSAQSIEYNGNVGDKVQLEAIVEPENASNKDVSWTSSNGTIATVDENGLVQLNSTFPTS